MTEYTTILLLADIHSNKVALDAVLHEVKDNHDKIDYIITLGDYVGYGPHPNEVLSWTIENADIMILGNHDLAVGLGNAEGFNKEAKTAALWTCDQLSLENRTFLSYLEQQTHFHIHESWSIFCLHGHPADPINGYLRPETPKEKINLYLSMIPKCRLMLHGHTHLPNFFESKETGITIINPGSVGQPRDNNPKASFGILKVNDDLNYLEYENIRVSYDIKQVARDILDAGLPRKLSERLFFGE
jgi:putative phosphoesterase